MSSFLKGLGKVVFGAAVIYTTKQGVDWLWGEDEEDAKYQKVSEETSSLKTGQQVLTYSCPTDQEIKQLRLKLNTANSTKIKITGIMVGGEKIAVNKNWIDKSNPFKKLLPMPKNPNAKIRIWVECDEETNITCVIGKKC
eukprot:371767_1